MPRRRLKGVVVSTKMQKTIGVRVDTIKKHPRFKKYIRRSKKYLVHDPFEDAKEGDIVLIEECRPISKRKHFKLVKILERAPQKEEIHDSSAHSS